MKAVILSTLFLLPLFSASGQSFVNVRRIQVMTLGVFHFNYPNLDAHRTSRGN